jgi:hypothetical protein
MLTFALAFILATVIVVGSLFRWGASTHPNVGSHAHKSS